MQSEQDLPQLRRLFRPDLNSNKTWHAGREGSRLGERKQTLGFESACRSPEAAAGKSELARSGSIAWHLSHSSYSSLAHTLHTLYWQHPKAKERWAHKSPPAADYAASDSLGSCVIQAECN